MSKIQKAMRRAKSGGQTDSTSTSRRRTARLRTAANQEEDTVDRRTSLLAESALMVPVNLDALERNRVVVGAHPAAAATSYKMLRTRILHRVAANNWHRIAITSARTSAGKSLTAVNTAISLAQETNQQVILVDLDLRRPSIANLLDIKHDYGIADYLEGNVPIEKIVTKTFIDRLLIIPNDVSVDNSSELLSSEKMKELVDIVSDEHNSSIVLFDLPPLLETDDFLAFSPFVDATLLVVSESETRQTDLYRSWDLINNMNVLGLILNKSRGDEYPAGYYP